MATVSPRKTSGTLANSWARTARRTPGTQDCVRLRRSAAHPRVSNPVARAPRRSAAILKSCGATMPAISCACLMPTTNQSWDRHCSRTLCVLSPRPTLFGRRSTTARCKRSSATASPAASSPSFPASSTSPRTATTACSCCSGTSLAGMSPISIAWGGRSPVSRSKASATRPISCISRRRTCWWCIPRATQGSFGFRRKADRRSRRFS